MRSFEISRWTFLHYTDVIMSAMASQITGASIVYSTVCLCADQRKHQSSASLAFVWGIYRWPVNSTHKGPVTGKMCLKNRIAYSCPHLVMRPHFWKWIARLNSWEFTISISWCHDWVWFLFELFGCSDKFSRQRYIYLYKWHWSKFTAKFLTYLCIHWAILMLVAMVVIDQHYVHFRLINYISENPHKFRKYQWNMYIHNFAVIFSGKYGTNMKYIALA